MIWSVLWMLSMSEFPRQHKRLSKAERRYIHATLLQETIQAPRTVSDASKHLLLHECALVHHAVI